MEVHHSHMWLRNVVRHVDENRKRLHPVLEEFRQLVERDSRLYFLTSSMFEQIPGGKRYERDPTGRPQIRSFQHMLEILNVQLTEAPRWNSNLIPLGLVGLPINAMLVWPMATTSGFALFLDPKVNAMWKKVLNAWGVYLRSPQSATVLNCTEAGWFGEVGLRKLEDAGNLGRTTYAFHELYDSDPSAKYYGFVSWDAFFTRTFRDGIRPVVSPDDDDVIINPCESYPYLIQHDVKYRDRFWLKAQRYSLYDMLAYDELSSLFIGGTIYQAFLGSTSYHRWHSPVSGTIVKAFIQAGSYFSEPPFEDIQGEGGGDADNQLHCQAYLSATATRAVFFIEADNPAIGLIAFLAIGMAEISTCEITVKQGQHVMKGQETGMFHYGGSTQCVIFRDEVDLYGFPTVTKDRKFNVAVNSQLARVKRKYSCGIAIL